LLSCPSANKGKPCIPNRYAFTGREWDADIALYYYRARWYDPETKRFTQEDLVFESTNKYKYVDNNPLSSTDPSGATGQSPVVGAAGGLILLYLVFTVFKYFGSGLEKSDPNTRHERKDVVHDSNINEDEFEDMQKADVDLAEGAVDLTKAAATANGGYADGIVGFLCDIGITAFCPVPPCGE
jgi:RHS repeat-associated protein